MIRYTINNNYVNKCIEKDKNFIIEIDNDLFSVMDEYKNGIDFIIGFYSAGSNPYVAEKHTLSITSNMNDLEDINDYCDVDIPTSTDNSIGIVIEDYGRLLFSSNPLKIYNLIEFYPSIIIVNDDMIKTFNFIMAE